MITITERAFVNNTGEPEFYSHYEILNVKNHQPYSSLLRINVLYLDQTELAIDEDIANDLVHWAKLFKATTWEDIKSLANGNPTFEEVANKKVPMMPVSMKELKSALQERRRLLMRKTNKSSS